MATRLDALEKRIAYSFNDRSFLERALTHGSYGDGRRKVRSYERLEFLGDRVLGLITARRLFEVFEGMDEGGLAHRLNALVNKEACAKVARMCQLGEALKMSSGEERLGGRDKTSILGDATEALLGAIYMDGGLAAAEQFYDRYWGDEIEALTSQPKDPKSRLQEWTAANGWGSPTYALTERSGPDHRPVFTVSVEVEGLDPASGEGATKQAAQRAAAEALLERERVHER